MIQKKDSSKIFIIGSFLLLIIIFLGVAIIYEKNKKENNRIIKINLDTKVEKALNWKFSTKTNFINAKIGQIYKIDFNVENYSSNKTSGRAIYEVKPNFLDKYFVEIDCFCYKKQTLLPGERSTYSITFYIDPKIISDFKASDIKDINISYTFLNI
jgi:cytochrome c oxidase assembly protein subunit 11